MGCTNSCCGNNQSHIIRPPELQAPFQSDPRASAGNAPGFSLCGLGEAAVPFGWVGWGGIFKLKYT